jgi:hypothetical protein
MIHGPFMSIREWRAYQQGWDDAQKQAGVGTPGCARGQNTTQFCAEAVDWQAKYDREAEIADGLRKANDRLSEAISHLTKLEGQ